MTHYRMAVLTNDPHSDIDCLLCQYSEYIEVEPYIYSTRQDYISYWRERVNDAFERVSHGSENSYEITLAQHANDSDEQLHRWSVEFSGEDTDDFGNILSTYNPLSKYDYYTPIETKTLREWVEEAREVEENSLRQQWRDYSVHGYEWLNEKYFLESYGSEDVYVKSHMLPEGWGVVTPDGVWHEPGRVGWFATNDATSDSREDWVDHFNERFVEPFDPDYTWVTIIDCHI